MHSAVDFTEESPPSVEVKGIMEQSALQDMPKDRVRQLTAKALLRFKEIRREMGWAAHPDNYSGWMRERWRYWQQYEDDWEWRKTEEGYRGVYKHSNDSLNDVKRGVQHAGAKMFADFFELEPFANVRPWGGHGDDELRDRIDKRCQWQFRLMGTKNQCETVGNDALVQGEGIAKIRFDIDRRRFKTWARVLVFAEGDQAGQKVLAGGEPITEGDWVPHPAEIEKRAAMEPEELQVALESGELGPPMQVAIRDYTLGRVDDTIGQVSVDEAGELAFTPVARIQYSREIVEREVEANRGVRVEPLPLGSYGFPLKAESMQQADCVWHCYERSLSSIANVYRRKDLLADKMADVADIGYREDESTWTWIKRKVGEIFRNAKADSEKAVSGSEMDGSPSELKANSVRNGHLVDMCIHFDADGDGFDEDVFVTLLLSDIDASEAIPLYWDYVGAFCPKAERPMYAVRALRKKNTICGTGFFEWWGDKQKSIERDHNLIKFRNGMSGFVKFFNKDLVKNAPNGLEFGGDKIYEPKDPTTDVDRIFQSKPLFEPTDALYQMMQETRAALALDMGVQNEAQGQAVGLPSSDTATGVTANQESSAMLSNVWESCLARDMEQLLAGVVRMDFMYMDEVEDFEWAEGQATRIGKLRRDEIEDLDMNVTLLLTKKINRQQAQNNASAIPIVERWIDSATRWIQSGIPAAELKGARAIFVDQLKRLDIQDAEERLPEPEVIEESIQAAMMAAQPMGGGSAQGPAGEIVPFAGGAAV